MIAASLGDILSARKMDGPNVLQDRSLSRCLGLVWLGGG